MSFETYLKEIQKEVGEGREWSQSLQDYAQLNLQRMSRLLKTTKVDTGALRLNQRINVLAITEGWCGDAAQSIPVWERWAGELNISTRYLSRDAHPDIMDAHLTDGARSIPVFIWLDDQFEVLGTWGPRPKALQRMVIEYKAKPEPKPAYAEFSKQVQLWYAKDKQAAMQQEWRQMVEQLNQIIPS